MSTLKDVFAREAGPPTVLRFSVAMTPQPQGSAKAFVVGKRAIVTSDNAKLKDYRQMVAWSAQAARPAGWLPLDGPVQVTLTFAFLKPKSAPKKRTRPTTRPDLDKIVRAVLDGLKGIGYRDDSQVTSLSARKRFGYAPETTVLVEAEAEL